MADPDREIRRGAGHPDPEIRGVGGDTVSKKFFSALWASFWSENKGAGDGPLPWIRHWTFLYNRHTLQIPKMPVLKRELTVSIHNHEKRLRE